MKYDLKYVIFIQRNKKYGKLDFFFEFGYDYTWWWSKYTPSIQYFSLIWH